MTIKFPDGCTIPEPDDHCSCFQAASWCTPADPCCRHNPELHDPDDNTAYGQAHRKDVKTKENKATVWTRIPVRLLKATENPEEAARHVAEEELSRIAAQDGFVLQEDTIEEMLRTDSEIIFCARATRRQA